MSMGHDTEAAAEMNRDPTGVLARLRAAREPAMIRTIIAAAGIALSLTSAQAEQRKHHGVDGRAKSYVTTSGNITTFHDARGRVTGRAVTTSSGNTIFYDPAGRSTGTFTTTPKPQGK